MEWAGKLSLTHGGRRSDPAVSRSTQSASLRCLHALHQDNIISMLTPAGAPPLEAAGGGYLRARKQGISGIWHLTTYAPLVAVNITVYLPWRRRTAHYSSELVSLRKYERSFRCKTPRPHSNLRCKGLKTSTFDDDLYLFCCNWAEQLAINALENLLRLNTRMLCALTNVGH